MTAVPAAQISGVYQRRIGDIVVTAISDGYLDGVYEFMRDITPQDAEKILKESVPPGPAAHLGEHLRDPFGRAHGAGRHRLAEQHGSDARPHAEAS